MEKNDHKPSLLLQVRRAVWNHYKKNGRHDLPWRKTTNPYRVLVSEIMLQQTQVARVIPKYRAFLILFPNVRALADAPLRDVLVAWQGLGYNRRAKALHAAARAMCDTCAGKVPKDYDALLSLPGIGPYTAGAVCVFAYNKPHPLVETNIRTVLFHHLLNNRTDVPDSLLREAALAVLDTRHPREWHWALMDYGASLKQSGVRMNDKSRHYRTQSKFSGSDREVRGAIVRELSVTTRVSLSALSERLQFEPTRTKRILQNLVTEGLVVKKQKMFSLPDAS